MNKDFLSDVTSDTSNDIEWGEMTFVPLYDKDYQETDYYVGYNNNERPLFVNNYSLIYKKQYATGGYVDYTGPAWVDGTKSHPEYMLNAAQTQQFETLVAALSNIYHQGMSPIKQSTQNSGDATYTFYINIDQMASDYDVDQLISRIEQKMVDSSKYRNITILKKSQ